MSIIAMRKAPPYELVSMYTNKERRIINRYDLYVQYIHVYSLVQSGLSCAPVAARFAIPFVTCFGIQSLTGLS